MNRYIVKNCPTLTPMNNCFSITGYCGKCEECDNCLIKQEIEKLKSRACSGIDCDTCVDAGCNIKVSDLAKEILDMFEIEVINNAG